MSLTLKFKINRAVFHTQPEKGGEGVQGYERGCKGQEGGGKVSKARTPPFVTKKYYGAHVCMNDMRAKILGCFPRSKKVS